MESDNNKKLSEFVTEQLRLLNLEKAAEAQKEKAEQRENGEVISVLVEKTQIPSYGGTIVTLKNRNPQKKHAIIRRGENVALDKCDGSEPLPGILVKVGFNTYDVSVEEDRAIFAETKKWDIIKVPNIGQFLEMEKALRDIQKNQSPLRDVLFGLKNPSQNKTSSNQSNPLSNFASSLKNALLGIEPPPPLTFHNTSLDKSQKNAVESTLNQNELSVVHGPPGTGKTTTLVEIIWQCVQAGEKVLMSAASNVAVDNLGERLVQEGIKVIRIGHPARVSEGMLEHSLSHKVLKQKEALEETRMELQRIQDDIHNRGKKRGKPELMTQLKSIQKKRDKQKRVVDNLSKSHLLDASVVLGTLIGCKERGPLNLLPENHFSTCVIDECGQSLEMACWIVIPRAPRLILAGDHLQLPPTVITKNQEAAKKLSVSLMERLRDRFFYGKDAVFHMLDIQYRMNEKIMDWSSKNFYHQFLYAAESVKGRRLTDLDGVANDPFAQCILKFYDTSGQQLDEIKNSSKNAPSYANLGEAAIVIKYIQELARRGVTSDQIAVITPYNYQVDVLKANLIDDYPDIEIKSVDGFQGREKEVVIISMVRSNKPQNLGFLVERRRLNVAVTRAKRQLILVCDAATVSKDDFLAGFVKYMREHGEVETAPKHDTSSLVVPVKNAPPTPKPVKSQNMGKIPSLDKFVAVDCEFVGVGEGGYTSRLARISLVDSSCNTLLDSFVAVAEEVTRYNTKISGVRPEDLAQAESFDTVMGRALALLKDKIIVGHSLEHDFEVMVYYPPEVVIRDTAKYFKKGKTPSLKGLVDKHLGKSIQIGEHSSDEDARATMELYLKFRDEWEASLTKPTSKKAVKQKKEKETKAKGSEKSSDQKGPKTVDQKFERLKTLPADYYFCFKDFTWAAQKKNLIKVQWAEVWIKRRSHGPAYAGKYDTMGIIGAFNWLSNKQLRKWIHFQKVDKPQSAKTNNNVQPQSSKSVKSPAYSFEKLRTLPPNHVFSQKINQLKPLGNLALKAVWAEEWVKYREDIPSLNVAIKHDINLTLEFTFNNFSNKQLRRWIKLIRDSKAVNKATATIKKETKNDTKKPKSVGNKETKFMRLQTLPPGHVFTEDDLSDVLKMSSSLLASHMERKPKLKEAVKWGNEWIKRRKDRPNYQENYVQFSLLRAFNELSNLQLKIWINNRDKA